MSQTKTLAEVIIAFNLEKRKTFDPHYLCNGHDFCSLIALACRRKINNLNANQCKREDIEQLVVLGYDSLEFKTTDLYNSIKEWESKHLVYILKI